MINMTLNEQRHHINRLGPEMARTGLYANWEAIIRRLLADGAISADVELGGYEMKRWLNRMCAQAADPSGKNYHSLPC